VTVKRRRRSRLNFPIILQRVTDRRYTRFDHVKKPYPLRQTLLNVLHCAGARTQLIYFILLLVVMSRDDGPAQASRRDRP